MDSTGSDEFTKTYRIAVFLGAAMIASLFVYAAIVEILRHQSYQGIVVSPQTGILRSLLYGFAVLVFFLIRFIRHRMLLSRETRRGAETFHQAPAAPRSRFLPATVASYALCESIAIYGLVLFLATGSVLDFYVLTGLSLVAFAIYFPRRHQWEESIRPLDSG